MKISLMQLIRTKAGLSLHASKQYVDDLVDGQNFFVQVPTVENARELIEDAEKLGANCQLDHTPEIQEQHSSPKIVRQKKVFNIGS